MNPHVGLTIRCSVGSHQLQSLPADELSNRLAFGDQLPNLREKVLGHFQRGAGSRVVAVFVRGYALFVCLILIVLKNASNSLLVVAGRISALGHCPLAGFEHHYFVFEAIAQPIPLDIEIELCLKVQPEPV